ncbi:hypothetical protein [Halostella salina]|uniref:hypothetical protein n=1 Tax=Halostella salina TaxID=1547897 RepID=UPI000EF794EC|nr:hypothetical protein [Halostella salina]
MVTWESRIHDDSLTPDERGELYEEFASEIADDVHRALEAAGVDDEYKIDVIKHCVVVWGDGWVMGEDDAEELRPVLEEKDIGDSSVSAFVEQSVDQYYVKVALECDVEALRGVLDGE